MGAKGAVEIIFRGKDVDEKTTEYTQRCVQCRDVLWLCCCCVCCCVKLDLSPTE